MLLNFSVLMWTLSFYILHGTASGFCFDSPSKSQQIQVRHLLFLKTSRQKFTLTQVCPIVRSSPGQNRKWKNFFLLRDSHNLKNVIWIRWLAISFQKDQLWSARIRFQRWRSGQWALTETDNSKTRKTKTKFRSNEKIFSSRVSETSLLHRFRAKVWVKSGESNE